MSFLKRQGRYVVAAVAVAVAFALSVQLGERGVQFDLRHATVSAQEGEEGAYQLSSLRILNRVLLQLKDNYVEPERIEPAGMLIASLEAVQNQIPEFVLSAQVTDSETTPETVEIQVADKRREFAVSGMESLWEMSLRLREIFLFVEQNLPEDPERKNEEIEYAAINGLLSTLDPHSNLLPPTYYEEMQTQTGGRFGGLGIVISIRDGQLTVISPIDGTPASQRGIKAQDTIVRIGEESTINMNLNEAVNLLRGEPGTDVDLWIQRANWPEPRQFTVTRAVIKIESVDSKALADKVGYLRIKNFQANTYSDVRNHLALLKEQMGGLQGLVLDMRDNPGGLLEQSIRVSDLFLEEGTIVSTVGVGNKLRETKSANRAGTESKYPIIVLVNGGSASASEIVSGALQKNDRAVVLGDTTFGKGTVQILYEFPDSSALKLTVAQYLTPGGISIQNEGIVPDLRTIPVVVTPDSVNMFLSQSMQRESDLAMSLANPSTQPDAGGVVRQIRYLDEEASEQDEETFVNPDEFREDFEIRLAQRLLVAAGEEYRRQVLLDKLQGELQTVFDSELVSIKGELDKLGVDWSDGQSPATADYELTVQASKPGPVAAGDSVELTAVLTNRGTEPLYRVKALTRSDNLLLRHREFIFGKVEPGESREWAVTMEVPKDSVSRHDRIEFVVSDDEREFTGEHHFDLQVASQDRPQFAFSYEILGGNDDGLLQVDEEVTLRMHLDNVGAVSSEEVMLYLKNLSGDAIYLNRGRGTVNDLEAQGSTQIDFEFRVRRVPESGSAKLEIDVYDMAYREFVQKFLEIPIVEEGANVERASGVALVGEQGAVARVGADVRSAQVAQLAAGAELPIVARSGDWVKVALGERGVWVERSDVTTGQGQAAEEANVTSWYRFQKPLVSLAPEQMLTTSANVQLKGIIRDESLIQDYYMVVQRQGGPRDVQTRKLNYERVDSDEVSFDASVPLFEGMNRISLVTRDESGLSTTESVFVYREPK
ncbi:hypothetical protein DL240_07055 [Lujinxingia litoralis]|uniref:PDZ domain-containing protein n=1 Tax=Lujinxingia litoralis TaxID=2211119 RepID=A0A328CBM0_9DELT|nr:MXAN_5808 family serine peptidase [Lujinxingia litoralis]RAL23899.1 hypothetical protein DL240_07055 [Lujinxingia litoralis]